MPKDSFKDKPTNDDLETPATDSSPLPDDSDQMDLFVVIKMIAEIREEILQQNSKKPQGWKEQLERHIRLDRLARMEEFVRSCIQ